MKRLWPISAALLVLLGTFLSYEAYTEHDDVLHREQSHLVALTNALNRNLGEQLRVSSAMLDTVREDLRAVPANDLSRTGLERRLAAIVSSTTGNQALWAVGAGGRVVATTRPEWSEQVLRTTELLQILQTADDPQRLYITAPFVAPSGQYTIALVKVGLTDLGAREGYVLSLLDTDYFGVLMGSMVYASDMRISVAHGAGKVIFSTQAQPDVRGADLSAWAGSLFNVHLQSGRPVNFFMDRVASTGDRRLVAISSARPASGSASHPLVVTLTREAAAVYAGWMVNTWLKVWVFAMALGAIALAHQQQARRLRTIAQLEQERLRAQESQAALRESERNYRQVTEALPQLVWTCQADGPCDYLSPQWVAYTGIAEASQWGYGWLDQLHPDDRQRTIDRWMETAGQGQLFDLDFRIRRHDGVYRWFHTLARPLKDEQGRIIKWFGTNTDVEEQRRTLEELELHRKNLEELVASRTAALDRALASAEKANQAKSAFLVTMSHEIRTPLNAIIGTSFLMGRGPLNPEQQRDLDIINTSGRNLLALVDDVLDLSKIEAGELDIEYRPFVLADTLQDLRTQFGNLARQKGLNLTIHPLPPALPPVLEGDNIRLKQVLINLLSNGIKFTEQGCVDLRVSMHPASKPDAPHLTFRVIDSGIGIAEEAQSRLFEPFKQADSSTTRRYGGTGLGLSIVKRLVELMGGSIRLQSQAGRGATFEFELPLRASALARLPSATLPVEHRPLQVLIADDDPIDRQMLMHLCAEFGWQAEEASGGSHMIALVERRLAQGQPVDCILLDWRMSRMNGVEAMAELQRRIGQEQMPSVIMVTAHDRSALEQALHAVRPDGILSKPIDPSALFNAVNEAVVGHSQDLSRVLHATSLQGGNVRWLHGVRVLAVDDSAINLEVIQRILKIEGATVLTSESGASALQTLDQPDSRVDIVLMDLQMPGMDGCEATRQIRQRPAVARTPVIALTAGATTTERDRALGAGMDDFLTKPINPAHLVRLLRSHIERHRGSPLALVASAQPPGAPVAPPQLPPATPEAPTPPRSAVPVASAPRGPDGWPQIPGIDGDFASRMMGGDVPFFERMLERFTAAHRHTMEQIDTALRDGDRNGAARLTHRLKGEAGSIGAKDIQSAAADLEEALRDDQADVEAPHVALARACQVVI